MGEGNVMQLNKWLENLNRKLKVKYEQNLTLVQK